MAHEILFFLFSVLTIAGALMVITSKHPVRAVLSLVATFFCAAVLWLLIQAEFLALILIVVYVGAVMVLFLFVVMMIDVDKETERKGFVKYWILALVVGVLFLAMLIWVFLKSNFGLHAYPAPGPVGADYSNIKALGFVLFTQYIYPFEVAGALLLAAMMAAIALTFRGRKPGTRAQNIAKQIQTKSTDRLTMVKVEQVKKGKRK